MVEKPRKTWNSRRQGTKSTSSSFLPVPFRRHCQVAESLMPKSVRE